MKIEEIDMSFLVWYCDYWCAETNDWEYEVEGVRCILSHKGTPFAVAGQGADGILIVLNENITRSIVHQFEKYAGYELTVYRRRMPNE